MTCGHVGALHSNDDVENVNPQPDNLPLLLWYTEDHLRQPYFNALIVRAFHKVLSLQESSSFESELASRLQGP